MKYSQTADPTEMNFYCLARHCRSPNDSILNQRQYLCCVLRLNMIPNDRIWSCSKKIPIMTNRTTLLDDFVAGVIAENPRDDGAMKGTETRRGLSLSSRAASD
jgi:hypothetical protein